MEVQLALLLTQVSPNYSLFNLSVGLKTLSRMDILQDPVIVKERIDRNLEELANLASEDRSRSRKEILDELSK